MEMMFTGARKMVRAACLGKVEIKEPILDTVSLQMPPVPSSGDRRAHLYLLLQSIQQVGSVFRWPLLSELLSLFPRRQTS